MAGTDGGSGVLLYEWATGTVTLVAPGFGSIISANGAFVAFQSFATDLVPGTQGHDSGSGSDVFLYEQATGTVTLISHVPGAPGTTGNAGSQIPSHRAISADGAFVAFESLATNLVAGMEASFGNNVFLYERVSSTTAPDTVIDSGPAGTTTSNSATFAFSGTDDVTPPGSLTFECALDAETFAACASPMSYPSLADGVHTFQVRAIDEDLHPDPTPAARTWTIDTTAPNTTITAQPPATTQSTSASFSFTSADASATFECQLDSGGFTVCTSPRVYTSLAVGSHTFDVRAKDPAGNTDATPASFAWTIDPAVSIAITAPNGGEVWPIGSTQNITWTSNGITGNVKIELSRNAGTSWAPIIASTPNDGVHPWAVTGPATTQARIRVTSVTSPAVTDISDGNSTIGGGSITVQSPNGGETWPIGSTQSITWASTGLTGNVKVEVSRNGGTAWTLITSGTPNDGVHPWTVTGPATAEARIRVTSATDPTVSDVSNGDTTLGGGSITVQSPNGGETWPIGSSQTIVWTSSGLTGNVKIEMSRNGGTSWTLIIASTPDDGTHPWTVTGPATAQARIRVTSATDPTVADSSDANAVIQ